jgi:ribosomal protein L11 methyltransferase
VTSDEYSTAATDWLQVHVTVALDDAELSAQILLDSGSAGAQIDDTEVLLDESEDATLAAKSRALITGYLPASQHHDDYEEQLREALHRVGIAAQLTSRRCRRKIGKPLGNKISRRYVSGAFSSRRRGKTWMKAKPSRFASTPAWLLAPGSIPPRACAWNCSASSWKEKTRHRVLDVGCGSGILSIAANKLGATVYASDLDRFCVDATRDNARANDTTAHIVQAAGLSWTAHRFDLVVANLMSALLISLAKQLAGATRAGGTLVVSGISAPRADDVETALRAAGFQLCTSANKTATSAAITLNVGRRL